MVGNIMSNRYTKLLSNTFIFAIGTFGSKLMVFLLMPLYTRVLTTSDYGTMDVIVNISNMLLPLVMVSINDGVIRFGMDKSARRSDVFSIGIWVCLAGFGVFLLAYPLMQKIDMISSYTTLVYLYIFAAAIQGVSAQFVRSLGLVRLFAFNGILNTFATIMFNILFLVVLQWGINGYVLSVIAANFVSLAFLWWSAKLHRFIKIKGISSLTAREMIIYSLPLIPATIMWSITNVSDRFLVTHFLGEAENGLYSVAYKLPTVISIISAIFTQAWQLSAIGESDSDSRDKFYSDIFKSYQTVVFLAAGGILLLIKPLTRLLVSDAFFPSWQYTPLLVVSVVFSCFSSFYASFYMASKKNFMAMVTILIGAMMNVAMNLNLIPIYGSQGAAFATAASYMTVFFIRALDTRRFVRLDIAPVRFTLNAALLTVQVVLLLFDVKYLFWLELLTLATMLLVNLKSILIVLQKLYRQLILKRRVI